MSKRVAYFNREGESLSRADWETKLADRTYWCVREYDNGGIHLRLIWKGMVPNPDETWPDCYKLFELEVFNYDSEGIARIDPVMHGRSYATEHDAVGAYETFLERWTESHREGDTFVEEDNDLAPPAPPDLDSPVTDTTSVKLGIEDDGVGAW